MFNTCLRDKDETAQMYRILQNLMVALLFLPALGAGGQSTALKPYVGEYRSVREPAVTVSIFAEDGALFAEGPRMARRELLPQESPDQLLMVGTSVRLVMTRSATGVVESFVQSDSRDTYRRIGDAPKRNSFRAYERSEVAIPMRDGVTLHAVMLRPKKQSGSLPILLERTSYGVDGNTSDVVNERYTEMAEAGAIFVFEDMRGRYGSGGVFVMNRPVVHAYGDRKDKTKIDESTDAYDTVDWLVKNVAKNNGRVGVFGISYPGFLAAMAGIDPHPAVKAISPQAPMTDVWMGDDFFHNGAFRQTYGYDYVQGMESGKEDAFGSLKVDAFDYFLKAGNFETAAKEGGIAERPTAKAFLLHPAYDGFWRAMAVQPLLTKVTVPTLLVGGYWDQEDMWGTQAEYAALKKDDPKHELFLMMGPWNHGQWAGKTTEHLGALDFGVATTEEFRREEAEFFARYLNTNVRTCEGDCAGHDLTAVSSFQTGSNTWQHYAVWPPVDGITEQKLYLSSDGRLSFNLPVGADASSNTAYVAYPKIPVPYRHRPIQTTYGDGSQWYTWMAEDQRFVMNRTDVVKWQTGVLDHDVTVTGDVVADMFASTTGTDADWVVKLIDIYPDQAPDGMGAYQWMIAGEIFRGRYRTSFTEPAAIKPGEIDEYRYSLHAVDHVFLKGHRMMVTVQSSWFPLYDRNPQTFVPNIMTAPANAYRQATQRVYWSAEHPSHLELPVVHAK